MKPRSIVNGQKRRLKDCSIVNTDTELWRKMKMTICRTCNVPMTEVRRFTSERNEKFQRCPKCHGETKHLKIFERELYIDNYLHNKGAK